MRFINDATVTDLDWSKSSRRNSDPCFIMPGKSNNGVAKIVSIVDVSGSITNAIAQKFIDYNSELMALGLIGTIVLVQTDTEVVEVQEFTLGDDLSELVIRRGGGTDFRQVMQYVADEHSDARAILFLTDCECSNFGDDPGIPTLWLSYASERDTKYYTDRFLTFGEVVLINSN